jgi:hypothetical protein
MTPTEFELQIARIQSALAGAKAKVRWNDRFPDPDNPSQLRQVDITIRRNKSLAIVECRYLLARRGGHAAEPGVRFPRFFVFQQVSSMLPVFPEAVH